MLIRRKLAQCLFALILVTGCGSKESTAEAEAEGESQANPRESSWQLADDSDFTATIDPWPASQGQSATIHAAASPDDGDQKFRGTVHYRILTDENGQGSWEAMTQTSVNGAELAEFAARTTLPSADKVWIQFRLKQQTDGRPEELTGWSVELED